MLRLEVEGQLVVGEGGGGGGHGLDGGLDLVLHVWSSYWIPGNL